MDRARLHQIWQGMDQSAALINCSRFQTRFSVLTRDRLRCTWDKNRGKISDFGKHSSKGTTGISLLISVELFISSVATYRMTKHVVYATFRHYMSVYMNLVEHFPKNRQSQVERSLVFIASQA